MKMTTMHLKCARLMFQFLLPTITHFSWARKLHLLIFRTHQLLRYFFAGFCIIIVLPLLQTYKKFLVLGKTWIFWRTSRWFFQKSQTVTQQIANVIFLAEENQLCNKRDIGYYTCDRKVAMKIQSTWNERQYEGRRNGHHCHVL